MGSSSDGRASKERRPIKLRSSLGTGYTYVTGKNKVNARDRIVLKKYDPPCRVQRGTLMRPDIHPDYQPVVFEDSGGGQRWLTGSTIKAERTTIWEDGNEYPHVVLDISMYTHPFFTGQQKIVDTAGRIERFNKRYGRRQPPR